MILKAVFLPKKYIKRYTSDNQTGWDYFFRYALTFGLIGPVLSFYSLTTQMKYSIGKAFLYSITTYLMDLLVVLIFSYFVFRFFKKDFHRVLKMYILVNIPIWLSDISDIYQPLRILSNIGLIYSFYLLYRGLEIIGLKKRFFILSVFHLILYVMDAVLSEIIATNPILLKLLQK